MREIFNKRTPDKVETLKRFFAAQYGQGQLGRGAL